MTKRSLSSTVILLVLGLGWTVAADAQPFAYITRRPYGPTGPSIVVLNLANNKVAATISESDAPTANKIAITSDGSRAVVTAGNSLLVINTATNKITARVRLGNLVPRQSRTWLKSDFNQ